MNINGINNTGNIGNRRLSAYDKTANVGAQIISRDRQQPADEIKISGKAIAQRELDAETKRIARELQETAAQPHKIEELKAQVENGTYTTNTSDVVASIMSRFV